MTAARGLRIYETNNSTLPMYRNTSYSKRSTITERTNRGTLSGSKTPHI